MVENQEVPSAWCLFYFSQEKQEAKQGFPSSTDFSSGSFQESRSDACSVSLRVASQTSSFLCELKRFLAGVTSQDHLESPPLQLSSLQSLPPLTLDRSTSEATLARLIHSPSLTVLSFGGCCSSSQVHQGELALSPTLSEELRQRLEQTITHLMEVIREEEAGQEAMRRLGRLMDLSAFLRDDPATGDTPTPWSHDHKFHQCIYPPTLSL